MLHTKEPYDLSIIIPSWNSRQLLYNCLQSIKTTQGTIKVEVIVIDNNSTDGSVEMITQYFPQTQVIVNKENKGFAEPNNQGLAIAQGKYILMLNNDTVVHQGTLAAMISFLDEHPRYGAATCTLLNDDGSIQYFLHRRFPSAIRLPLALVYKRWKWLKPFPVIRYLYLDKDFKHDFDIEQAAAACLMIRRDIIDEIGGLLDAKRFPFYYNDVDLCYRLAEHNYLIRCLTDVQITHLKGKTTGSLAFYKNAHEYVYSSLQFFAKHNQSFNKYVLQALYVLLFTVLGVYSTIAYLVRGISRTELTKRWHVVKTAATV